ncbi:MAG: GerMN domain-containing protein [Patescibacteria group bacterium]|jgi:hypothetical protein
MKLTFKIFLLTALLLALILGLRLVFGGPEDGWLCQDGNWVKHGNPSAPAPTSGCGAAVKGLITDERVKVDEPAINAEVTSPLTVKGEARGVWFFEASFPVKLLAENGEVLASGIATAGSNWMTEDFVPFAASLEFTAPAGTAGSLVLERDNPSDLPENDAQVVIPVKFGAAAETTAVKVYFNNNQLDPEVSCNKVFSVERKVAKTEAIARAALEELLKGPSAADLSAGFTTSLNFGVKIQQLTIVDGVATIDFDKTLDQAVGGSCRVGAIRAQITETLKQFPTVKNVIISIDGRTEDILQP